MAGLFDDLLQEQEGGLFDDLLTDIRPSRPSTAEAGRGEVDFAATDPRWLDSAASTSGSRGGRRSEFRPYVAGDAPRQVEEPDPSRLVEQQVIRDVTPGMRLNVPVKPGEEPARQLAEMSKSPAALEAEARAAGQPPSRDSIKPLAEPGIADRWKSAVRADAGDESLVGFLRNLYSDTDTALAEGAWNLVRQRSPSQALAKFAEAVRDDARSSFTPEQVEAEKQIHSAIENGTVLGVLGTVARNPRLLITEAAKTAPNMVEAIAVGNAIGAAARPVLGAAFSRVLESAGQNPYLREPVRKALDDAVAKAARGGAVASEATLGAQQVYEDVIRAGGSPEDAQRGAGLTFIGYLAVGRMTGGGVEGAIASGRRAGRLPSALNEGREEYLQNWAEAAGKGVASWTPPDIERENRSGIYQGIIGSVAGGAMGGGQQAPQPATPAAIDLARDAGFLKPQPINFTPAGSVVAQERVTPIVVPAAPAAAAQAQEAAQTAPGAANGITPISGQRPDFAAAMRALNERMEADEAVPRPAPESAQESVAQTQQTGEVPESVAKTQQSTAAQDSVAQTQHSPAEGVAPTSIWTGRRGDGYVNEADAAQALPGRQAREPALIWRANQRADGKWQLEGYTPEATTETTDGQPERSAGLGQAQGAWTPGGPAGTDRSAPAGGGRGVDAAGAVGAGGQAVPAAMQGGAGVALVPDGPGDHGLRGRQPEPGAALQTSAGRSAAPRISDKVAFADLRGLESSRKSQFNEDLTLERLPDRMVQSEVVDVAAAFGVPVAMFRATHGNPSFGAVVVDRSRVYINVDAPDAPLKLTVHEIVHSLPPGIRKALVERAMRFTTADLKGQFLWKYSNYQNKSESDRDEEMVAMFAQDDARTPQFWESLREKLGDRDFAGLAKHILSKLNQLLTRVREGDDRRFFTDIRAVRELVTEALARAERGETYWADDLEVSGDGGVDVGEINAEWAGFSENGKASAADNLRRWFGQNNTMVMPDGSPRALYHGTTKANAKKIGVFQRSKYGAMGSAIYLGDSAEASAGYDDGAMLKVYARGKYLNNLQWTDYVNKHGWKGAEEAARADGWAGVYDEKFENAVAVWDPQNIKSADQNSGAYSDETGDIRYSELPRRRDGLREDVAAEVPGIKEVSPHLTRAEKAKLRKDTAAKLVEVYKVLPSVDEMAAVAWAGRAKLGWYEGSFEAIQHIFGEDGWRFTGLLAATSPQVSVEVNLENALRTWKNWVAAGRPTDKAAIKAVMGRSVQGVKGEDSVLDAWVNNSFSALTAASFADLVLSGPKVDSFMRNLQGDMVEVTNDAWIANYILFDQALFSGGINKAGTDPGKGFGYMATSARVRAAAKRLSKLSGREWQPAEVQETIWSWAMSTLELMDSKGESRGAQALLDAGLPTDEAINATPDFRTLFHAPRYAEIIEGMGKAAELASLREAPKAAKDAGGEPFEAARQRQLVEAAALRLEFLVRQRRTNVQLSWEARPGESTGVLPGMHTAPLDLQQQYLADIFAAIESAGFKDQLGFSLRDTLFGPSAWQGKVLAGAQTMSRPGVVGVEGRSVAVDAKTREKLSRVAAALGYVLNQEGVYWHWPIYKGGKAETENGFEIDIGRSFTNDEMARLYKIISRRAGHTAWAPANTPKGARILNFTGTPNKQFHRTLQGAVAEFAKKFDGHIDSRSFSSDGDAIENDWKEHRDGHLYAQRISKGGRPDLLKWAAGPLQDAVNAVAKRYSEEHEWGPWRREDVQFSESAAAEPAGPAEPPRGSRFVREQPSQEGVRGAVTGIHYGLEKGLSVLSGAAFGRGIKGAEAVRLALPGTDPRIRRRVYFYLPLADAAALPRPEAGLGAHVYRASLGNLFDPTTASREDRARVHAVQKDGSDSAYESAVLDAGYRGHINREQGTAVVLNADVPVAYEGTIDWSRVRDRKIERIAPRNETRREGGELVRRPSNEQLVGVVRARPELVKAAPTFTMQYGEARVAESEAAAANEVLARHGDFRFEVDAMFSESAVDERPLLAPNGKPSKLTRKQWEQVRTPEFKRWFGDWEAYATLRGGVWNDDKGLVSKAVDPDTGEPMVLYHGSQNAGFAQFWETRGTIRGDLGIFLTSNKSMARSYIRRGRERDVGSKDLESVEQGYADPFGGIYGLFANIRRATEEDFKGANWDGQVDHLDLYEVRDENGDQAYTDDGRDLMSEAEAEDLAQSIGGTVEKASPLPFSTDDVVRMARADKNDGAIMTDVMDDGGGPGYDYSPSTVVAVFDPRNVKSADFNEGSFNEFADIRYSDSPWYSALSRAIEKGPGQAPAEQWRAFLRGLPAKGVKPDEIEWSGIEEWLALQSGKISRQSVLDYLGANGVRVEEVVLGYQGRLMGRDADEALYNWVEENGNLESPNFKPEWQEFYDSVLGGDTSEETLAIANRLGVTGEPRELLQGAYDGFLPGANPEGKYANYTLPGGTNYREVLLTLPERRPLTNAWRKAQEEYGDDDPRTIAAKKAAKAEAGPTSSYKSSHWDTPNVLAHIRVNDRVDADGKKVLFVEEIQSDWGQEGKKKGFADPLIKPVTNKEYQKFLDGLVDAYADMRAAQGVDRRAAESDAINMLISDLAEAVGKGPELERMKAGRALDRDGDRLAPLAPFVAKREFAVFKDGKEVTRTDKDGKEVRERYGSMEEAQRAAEKKGGEARDMGYGENTDAWVALALKRIIKMAVDEGYDRVAFVTGAQSADRYSLDKQVDELRYGDGLLIAMKNGAIVVNKEATPKELPDLIGKEAAERLLNNPTSVTGSGYNVLSGVDLKVGGEGMKAFYDVIVPNAVKGLLKKMGGGAVASVPMRLEVKDYERVTRYVGPDRTVADVEAMYELSQKTGGDIRDNPLTGEREMFAINRVTVENDVKRVLRRMRSGMSFADAIVHPDITEYAASLFGGSIEHVVVEDDISQQPGFDITPAMRERAAGGMPLFSENGRDGFKSAFARVSAGAASADDVHRVISRPGFGNVYEGPLARDLDAARRLQGELERLFPRQNYKDPRVDFQRGAIAADMSVVKLLDDEKLQALESLSREYKAPIVVRGMDSMDDPVVVNRLRKYGFESYGGMMEVGNRNVRGVGISMVLPEGGMTSLTPLFSEYDKEKWRFGREFLPARRVPKKRRLSDLKVGSVKSSPTVDTLTRYVDDEYPIINAARMAGDDVGEAWRRAVEALPGRTADAVKQAHRAFIEPLSEAVAKASKRLDMQPPQIVDALGNYLLAQHAPERNATLRANGSKKTNPSGMSEEEASQWMGFFRSEPEMLREFEQIVPLVKAVQAETDRIKLAAGLLTQEEIDARSGWQHYVSLRGDPGASETGGSRVGGGWNNDVDPRAKGRDSLSANPLINTVNVLENAIRLAEMARVKKATHEFAIAHPDIISARVERLYRRPLFDEDGNFAKAVPNKDKFARDAIVYRNGDVEYHIEIGDGRVLESIKRLERIDMGQLLRGLGRLTSLMGRLFTQFSPHFPLVNFIRDLQQQLSFIAGSDIKVGGRSISAVKAAFMIATRYPATFAAAASEVLGRAPSGKYTRLARELSALGGTSGLTKMFSDEDALKNFVKDVAQRAGKAKTSLMWDRFVSAVEGVNDVFELTTRVAAYSVMRDMGMPAEQAAGFTKNLLNFNKAGTETRKLGNLYMFLKPAVQDVYLTSKLLRTRKGAIVFASMYAGAVALYTMLRELSGDDDEDKRLKRMDTRPASERRSYYILPVGGAEPVRIPVGFGLPRMAWGLATVTVDSMLNPDYDGFDAVDNAFKSMTSTLSPLQLSDINMFKDTGSFLITTLSPTIGVPFVEHAQNKTKGGSSVYKENRFSSSPDYAKGFASTPKEWKDAAQWIYDNTNGKFDLAPETLQHFVRSYGGGPASIMLNGMRANEKERQGDPLTMRDVPVLQAFRGPADRYPERRFRELDQVADEVARKVKDRDLRSDLPGPKVAISKEDELKASFKRATDKVLADEGKAMESVRKEMILEDYASGARRMKRLEREFRARKQAVLDAYNEERANQ